MAMYKADLTTAIMNQSPKSDATARNQYLLYSLNKAPSDGWVATASLVTMMLLGNARSSSKRARRMCQSWVTRRKVVTLFRFAQAAVSKAFDRVSTDWKPSAMQHLKYFADPGYCAASSRGRTSRSTPEISIFFDFPDFNISNPRSIRFAPPVSTTTTSVGVIGAGCGNSKANQAKPSIQTSNMKAMDRLIITFSSTQK